MVGGEVELMASPNLQEVCPFVIIRRLRRGLRRGLAFWGRAVALIVVGGQF